MYIVHDYLFFLNGMYFPFTETRSPLSLSSEEEMIRDEGTYRLKYSKKT